MSAKKWLIAFFLTLILLLGALCAFNALTDPFGIFGDPLLDWYSYNMTQNPRAAKVAYIEQHHQEFDSYVVGCSSSSSFPTDALNRHFDAKFYNMIMYGADLLDVEQQSRWLIENYTCKNLFLSLYIDNGVHYDTEQDPYTYSMHYKTDGGNPVAYYSKYLFAKPRYAIDKWVSLKNDSYLKKPFDAFNPIDGTYDKKTRDVEPITDPETYLKEFPGFAAYPQSEPSMEAIEQAAQSVKRIKELCDQHHVRLTVAMVPVYYDYFNDFKKEEVLEFYQSIAEITDFWDFSMSSISFDPRYFYDETHFRNAVGEMAIARMGNHTDGYLPDDFGTYVTKENVRARIDEIYSSVAADPSTYTAQLPILTYHHLQENADDSNDMILSPNAFRAQLKGLQDAGYTAVSIEDLLAYTEQGTPLPEKPFMITFDDGYESNYTLAFPILKELNMKATIFAVGSSWGASTYKDTDHSIFPHLSTAQAKEMVESGLISIQSHSFDLHQAAAYETAPAYENMLKSENESEEAYIARLQADQEKMAALLRQELGYAPIALAYPHGKSDLFSETVLGQQGIQVTFGTQEGINTLVCGLPQSLRNLRRISVYPSSTAEQLIARFK